MEIDFLPTSCIFDNLACMVGSFQMQTVGVLINTRTQKGVINTGLVSL